MYTKTIFHIFFLAFVFCMASTAQAQTSSGTVTPRAATGQPTAPAWQLGDKGTADAATLQNCFEKNDPAACQTAASQGNAEAMRRLSLAYHYGSWGLTRDLEQSAILLDKAAKARSYGAQIQIATLYSGGVKDAADKKDAVLSYVWFSVAAHRTDDPKKKATLVGARQLFMKDIPPAEVPRAHTLSAEYIRDYGTK